MSTPTMIRIELNDGSRIKTEALHSLDRCDRCGAAALVRAVKDEMSLLFCGHHANKAATNLVETGWKLDDQSYRMFPESGSPSAISNSTPKNPTVRPVR